MAPRAMALKLKATVLAGTGLRLRATALKPKATALEVTAAATTQAASTAVKAAVTLVTKTRVTTAVSVLDLVVPITSTVAATMKTSPLKDAMEVRNAMIVILIADVMMTVMIVMRGVVAISTSISTIIVGDRAIRESEDWDISSPREKVFLRRTVCGF